MGADENNDLFNIMFDKCINGASFREMQNNIREYKQNALEENVNIKKKVNVSVNPRNLLMDLPSSRHNKNTLISMVDYNYSN